MTSGTETRQIAVIVERTQRKMGRWQYPAWRLLSAHESDAPTAPACERRDFEDGRSEFTWRGLTLTLYRDAAEGYWYNLSASAPSLFLVGRVDDTDATVMRPVLATVNHDEAAAYLETDDTVLSLPLPAGLCEWLEAFVARHYQPRGRKKRARQNWSEDAERETPRASRPVRDN